MLLVMFHICYAYGESLYFVKKNPAEIAKALSGI